jgi:Myb-like DNA-binding domain
MHHPGLVPLAASPLTSIGAPLIPQKRGASHLGVSHGATGEPPQKKLGKWTPEEDRLAIELRRKGMKWDDISKHLPGRSAISCRLRYQNYSEKRPEWDEERKNKLARLYNRCVLVISCFIIHCPLTVE